MRRQLGKTKRRWGMMQLTELDWTYRAQDETLTQDAKRFARS